MLSMAIYVYAAQQAMHADGQRRGGGGYTHSAESRSRRPAT